MSKRVTGPALYEKMRAQQFSGRAPVAPEVESDEIESSSPRQPLWAWLTPGRSLRIPVGYVLAVAAGIILLIVLAYTAGYQRGEGALRSARVSGGPALPGTTPPPEGPSIDPLVNQRNATGSPTLANTGQTNAPAPSQPVNAPREWPPVTSDPRLKGVNYFVLAETIKEGAIRLAEYCRSQGLETYVISRNNVKTRYMVIALPGFSADDQRSTLVKELEQRIHQIGDQWKATQRGETDLHDAYRKLYSGSPW